MGFSPVDANADPVNLCHVFLEVRSSNGYEKCSADVIIAKPDGSNCFEECAFKEAETAVLKSARQVKRRAGVLKARVILFSNRQQLCDGTLNRRRILKAKKEFKELVRILEEQVKNTILVCDNSVCSLETTESTIKSLRRQTQKLYLLAKAAKIEAGEACEIRHDPNDNRKVTEDYRIDVLRSINKLPKERMSCQLSR
jgi:hypothetical protein